MKRRKILAGVAFGGAALAASTARGQTYPARVVTLVVPFGAGSGSDVTARIVAQQLGPALGQNVIIEN